ncbi:MAG: SEC-C metal-binding domain-containing protein [Myxococcota bacterium]
MNALTRMYRAPRPCRHGCFEHLSAREREQAVAAMMTFDDAVRAWGYEPQYAPKAHGLFHAARMRNDATYKAIPVRDDACIYRRLVGFAVHELIHGVLGEPGEANWGVPWGLPYGVPDDTPAGTEEEYLFPYNLAEACAWAGVQRLAAALFGIEWPLLTARDVGTYGFVGGNAIVDVPPGFRAVPHWDRQHHPRAYYARARALEAQADAYMTDEVVSEWCDEIRAAAARGAAARAEPFPDPAELARIPPSAPGRDEPCLCGSGETYQRCCGA